MSEEGASEVADLDRRTRLWQGAMLASMVIGYSGYYLCRSNFSVTLPLLIDELSSRGIDAGQAKLRLGEIASMGVLAYAIGKFVSGTVTDFFGGRRSFLVGMVGSVGFTLAFAAAGGLPLFTLAWIGNRAVQSMGWVGMVKLASRWFPHSRYASVMGIISLSFLFGDAAVRAMMAWWIDLGAGWQGVFVGSAISLAVIALASAMVLRSAPGDRGLPEPAADGRGLLGEAADLPVPPSAGAVLRPLLSSPAFLAVCALSLGFTLIRETFNTWTPTYFAEAVQLSAARAASASALFPLFGGVSVIFAGFAGDRRGGHGRALIIVFGLVASAASLAGLASLGPTPSASSAIGLVALTGLLLIGPYSYLAGAVSLDFGGKQGSATACGFIDGVGYLGGVLAGGGIARVATETGWAGAFALLCGVSLVTALAGVYYTRAHGRHHIGRSG